MGGLLGPDDDDAFSLEVVFCFTVLSQTHVENRTIRR